MHFIHSSADLDNAVYQTLRGAFEYQGQKCSACSRVYIPASKSDFFLGKLVQETQKIKVGHVSDFEVFMGAVVTKQAFDKVVSFIERAKSAKDAKIICGGECERKWWSI